MYFMFFYPAEVVKNKIEIVLGKINEPKAIKIYET